MIPAFDSSGNLPAGIHEATLAEFQGRFANTPWRKKLFDKLLILITDLKAIGCTAVYVDGSYVTDKIIPSDYDACWEDEGVDEDKLFLNQALTLERRDLQKPLYGGDIFPASCVESDSGVLFLAFFQRDKTTRNPKGIVKLDILYP